MAPPPQILSLCCLPIKNWGKQTKESRDLLITCRKSGVPATQRSLDEARKEMKGNGKERNCENFTTKLWKVRTYPFNLFPCAWPLLRNYWDRSVISGNIWHRINESHWAFSWKVLKFYSSHFMEYTAYRRYCITKMYVCVWNWTDNYLVE